MYRIYFGNPESSDPTTTTTTTTTPAPTTTTTTTTAAPTTTTTTSTTTTTAAPTTTTTTTTATPTTTTTADPSNCQTGVVDNDLVCHIKHYLNISKVFHLSAYQQLSPNEVFPCVVYERQDDVKIVELAGNSGVFTATFNVYLICPDTATLRLWQEQLACTDGEYTANGWLWIDNDVEQYDTPVELQELGERQSLTTFTYIRQGK